MFYVNTDENEYFQTSDLPLVAALSYFGAKIEAIDRSNSARVIFHIRQEKGLKELTQAFSEHTLKVDPLQYFNCLKEIKTRLHNPTIY